MKKLIIILFFFLPSIINASDISFRTYSNARYNYQLNYPVFLIPQGETENGDGQKFIGKNAELTVYGSFSPNLDSQQNPEKFNIQEEFNYEKKKLQLEGFEVSYAYLKKNKFVITASNKIKIVYLKKIFVPLCGVHLYFWLYYPQDAKKQWDPLVTRISKSFKYSNQECQGDYIIQGQ